MKKMSPKKMTYNEAVEELDEILSYLEHNESIDMEVISAKVKRAAVLMELCRKQLHEMDKELEKVLESVDERKE